MSRSAGSSTWPTIALVVVDAEALLNDCLQFDPPPAHDALDGTVGADLDDPPSVPYRLLKEEVDVRVTARTVEVFHRHRRVASHARVGAPHAAISA